MLKTLRLTDKDISTGTAMLLGGFDGLHIGHRRLLSCAKASGLPVGVMTIIGGKDEALFTFPEREDIFRRAGLDFVYELDFAEIKELSPKEFLALLEKDFSPKLFVCGDDFRFGKGAQGTAETIKQATQVRVEVENLLTMDGEKISTRTVNRKSKRLARRRVFSRRRSL